MNKTATTAEPFENEARDEFGDPELDDSCPHCFESSGYMSRTISATWYEPAWEDTDYSRPCSYCHGTGEYRPVARQPKTEPSPDDIAF